MAEEGLDRLLIQTIRAAQKSVVIDEGSAKRAAVNTISIEKNIAYQTDDRLYVWARGQLAELAQKAGVDLRQSYARLAPRLALQVGRYAHAIAVQTHALGVEKAERLYRPRHSRPAAQPLGHPRGCPTGPEHRQASLGVAAAASSAQGGRQDLRPA